MAWPTSGPLRPGDLDSDSLQSGEDHPFLHWTRAMANQVHGAWSRRALCPACLSREPGFAFLEAGHRSRFGPVGCACCCQCALCTFSCPRQFAECRCLPFDRCHPEFTDDRSRRSLPSRCRSAGESCSLLLSERVASAGCFSCISVADRARNFAFVEQVAAAIAHVREPALPPADVRLPYRLDE